MRACAGDTDQHWPGALHPACTMTRTEKIFVGLVRALLSERRTLRAGAVLDVGAHRGETACLYAAFAPERPIFAVDPSPDNVEHIQNTYGPVFGNLRAQVAALGSKRFRGAWKQVIPAWNQVVLDTKRLAKGDARAGASDVPSRRRYTQDPKSRVATFPILRVDDLFYTEPLAFAHIDTEGSELEVLRGAVHTLERDQFVFSFEVHADTPECVRLLKHVESLGYQILLIQEVCGQRVDCRNLLAIPPWSQPYDDVPILRLMVDAGRLVPLSPPFTNRTLATLAPNPRAAEEQGSLRLSSKLCYGCIGADSEVLGWLRKAASVP